MKRRTFLTTAALGLLAAPRLGLAAKPQGGLFITQPPRPVPPLDIRTANGTAVTLEQFRGQAVVLNLWASWCMPCVAELPALDRLKPMVADKGIAVLALSLDRAGASRAQATYDRLGLKTLDILLDAERKAAEVLAAPALPSTLLLNRQGAEVARVIGGVEWDSPTTLRLLSAVLQDRPITQDMTPPPVTITTPP